MGMPAIVEEERGLACGGGSGIVDGKRNEGQVVFPVGVVAGDVMPQHFFKDAVGALCLTICLGVEGRRERGNNLESFAEITPEVGGEPGVSVRDEHLDKAVILENMSEKQVCQVCRSAGLGGGNQVNILGQLVDENQYGIVALTRLW